MDTNCCINVKKCGNLHDKCDASRCRLTLVSFSLYEGYLFTWWLSEHDNVATDIAIHQKDFLG